MRTWIGAECAAMLVAAAAVIVRAQDDAPPPAIAQDGVVNAASLMPPEFAAGALAPGARIQIHGWRLGPAKEVRAPQNGAAAALDGISAEIVSGSVRTTLLLESVQQNLIEAAVPFDAPIGAAQLIVKHGEDASLPAPVKIAAAAFGAYTLNGRGWGPGKFMPEISARHPAHPGQTVTLSGIGMGVEQGSGVPVRVGGKSTIAALRRVGGMDQLTFTLPSDTPEGCFVPVQVRGAPGVAGNVVTIAVNRGGGPCSDPGNWMREDLSKVQRAGLLMLLDADVLLALDPTDRVHYRMNAGFGAFVTELREPEQPTPLYALPPVGTCTSYTRTVRLRGMLDAVSPFQMLDGTGINAGKRMTVSKGSDTRIVGIARGHDRGFAGVVGGNAPLPSVKPSPLFFSPGTYEVAGGGDEVGAFHASIPMPRPLRWTNRDRIDTVDRARGVTVEWSAAHAEDFVVVLAMNVDNDSGAFGLSACVAPAAAGRFAIPPEALTNIPPTGKVGEVPVNSISLAELPGKRPASFTAAGIDLGVAYAITSSTRTVQFR